MSAHRRGYLDWLRGVAVLIMIESHILDAWTSPADRDHPLYGFALIVAGVGSSAFLFLAGLALPLAASARIARGRSEREAAAAAHRRGWQILGLAFLFRLQSWLLNPGAPAGSLLKVDILNIMGLAMAAAALLWAMGWNWPSRAALLASAAVAVALLTPPVRSSAWVGMLPDPVESYLRPVVGRGAFTLFPWAGFLLAGAALGVALDRMRGLREGQLMRALAVGGFALALAGYGASFLPSLYAEANFWTSSPTFFFLRLGVLIVLLPIGFAWEHRPFASPSGRLEPLQTFGRASLFVYWVHVELVYGVASRALHRRLPLEQAFIAFAIFAVMLFGLVQARNALWPGWNGSRPEELSKLLTVKEVSRN